MLEVSRVSKVYENQRGVYDIDFSMSRGEIVGFLGPNGAGKTTTMRMITGYLNPTRGRILVDGMSMADHPRKARRKIGYLPETPPLYPEMTVGAYLKFVADLRDVPVREQKRRIGEVIEKLGLKGRERQIIRSLSKGYKQRVGLAQAIIHKPDLLVLDEPTSGLDPKQIIEIRELIRELGNNHTVLLSTHILPEVQAICNRVLIINQGRIVMDGQPDQIAQSMADRFEVVLEVRGDKADVLRTIRETSNVFRVQEEKDGAPPEPGVVRVRVTARGNRDIREALFFRLAQQGMPILEMRRASLTLEEIFLKLTAGEPVPWVGRAKPAQAASAQERKTEAAGDAGPETSNGGGSDVPEADVPEADVPEADVSGTDDGGADSGGDVSPDGRDDSSEVKDRA
ncbi:MAG: multidrug ABC transporter ATP-binding protein [Candidatus Reconcilbacillus cellulovorans]|uniref:Multidrug ABC transporter ATP-binding protein n=1 Tax=Candidatus Reconcilbacillus cellulovorans TaxID=1906605 RepID=A0A2A6E2B6_9BACL|nr:MAG: multidrug ABC transporter ATP-binding protein [Candidatus Reconcilbacillus cellulovorans]